jgi:transcription antitermination factor NusG
MELLMPLLALEPTVFPETLLEQSLPEAVAGESWWVLHTRPRSEKALARQCMTRELPFYLPLYHKKWRSGGRMQNSYLPLFPGYFFLYGDSEVRHAALRTNLIANVIPVTDQLELHDDLMRVRRLIESDASVTPEDRLQPGAPVRITSGAMAGLEGKVLRREKNLRFFVEVKLLQQGVSVEIEGWMIEPLA